MIKNSWPYTNQVDPSLYKNRTKWPKISIVTPSYNQGQFIEETILSVLNQNYPNLEYIIIDGGSTDNTVDIIKKYEGKITYWISEKDNGQAHAINKGLKISSGEIVGWINSDDIYLKNAFFTIISFLLENNNIDFTYGYRYLIDANSNITGWSATPAFNPNKPGYNIPQETVFWRKEFQEKVGFLNEELIFAMDFDYFLRFYKSGKGQKLKKFIGAFRCYESNKSSTIMEQGYKESAIIWKKYFPSYPQNYLKLKKATFFNKLYMLISNWRELAIPYFKNRFNRL